MKQRSLFTTVLAGFVAGLVFTGPVLGASRQALMLAQQTKSPIERLNSEKCTQATGVPCAKFDDEPLCACVNRTVVEPTQVAAAQKTGKPRERMLLAG